jgi:N-acetylmuramoyl-L-alanine amidase
MVEVFLNAGHSKDSNIDCGAYNKALNLRENIVARKLTDLVSEQLTELGITNTVFQELNSVNEVAKEANKSGASIAVSIHLNSHTNTTACGVETLYCEDSQKGKTLAQTIQNELIKPIAKYTFPNRGIKDDSNRHLAVLRYTSMTACLIECGFISNQLEAMLVSTDTIEYAKAIATGIKNYLISIGRYKEPVKKKEVHIISIEPSGKNGTFDLYIDSRKILNGNKITTIVEYLEEKYKDSLY